MAQTLTPRIGMDNTDTAGSDTVIDNKVNKDPNNTENTETASASESRENNYISAIITEEKKNREKRSSAAGFDDETEKKRSDITIGEEDLWEEIGIHKTLGGAFFRNFVYMVLAAIISVVTFTFVIRYLIPYPTSKGYYDVSQGLFAFVFMLFDVGTAYGIERFIAEYFVKDKIKMMHYIQFYIWYQMFTGLIQVTGISIWILWTVPKGDLAHLAWIMLIINIKQYPGMLGTFRSVLRGFQRYDKTVILDFIDTEGFQFVTQIVFFLAGRWWGAHNPAIGELLGLSVGMVLGYYVDDFFNMWLSMHFFRKIIEKYGFTVYDAWRHDFDWGIVKECLKFGIGISWAPLIAVGLGLIKLQMSLMVVPGYTTWIVLANLGSGIGSSINMGDINITSPIAESLNNGKKKLSNFYVNQAFKYWAFLLFAMSGIIAVLVPILPKLIMLIPEVANRYKPALIFVIPGMIAILPDVPIRQFTRIITAAGKVMLKSGVELTGNLISLFLWYMCLYRWHVWEWGTVGVIFLFVLIDLPSKIMTLIVYLIYINRKIMKIKISWWQTFGASILTFVTVLVLGYCMVYFVFLPLLDFNIGIFGEITGTIITGVIGLLIIVFGFMIIVFPLLYALYGGWDEFGLIVLYKSYLLSGPSKPFIRILYWLSVKGSKISPLYNKYTMDFGPAFTEAEELLRIKLENQRKLQERLKRGELYSG